MDAVARVNNLVQQPTMEAAEVAAVLEQVGSSATAAGGEAAEQQGEQQTQPSPRTVARSLSNSFRRPPPLPLPPPPRGRADAVQWDAWQAPDSLASGAACRLCDMASGAGMRSPLCKPWHVGCHLACTLCASPPRGSTLRPPLPPMRVQWARSRFASTRRSPTLTCWIWTHSSAWLCKPTHMPTCPPPPPALHPSKRHLRPEAARLRLLLYRQCTAGRQHSRRSRRGWRRRAAARQRGRGRPLCSPRLARQRIQQLRSRSGMPSQRTPTSACCRPPRLLTRRRQRQHPCASRHARCSCLPLLMWRSWRHCGSRQQRQQRQPHRASMGRACPPSCSRSRSQHRCRSLQAAHLARMAASSWLSSPRRCP